MRQLPLHDVLFDGQPGSFMQCGNAAHSRVGPFSGQKERELFITCSKEYSKEKDSLNDTVMKPVTVPVRQKKVSVSFASTRCTGVTWRD